MTNTPIKLQGKKTRLLDRISRKVIERDLWVEPFLGSGVIGFNLAPRNAVFSDINPHIINFYKAIQENQITPEETRKFLESEGKKLSKDLNYYYEVRERFNKFHDPLNFLFLNRSCYNGLMRFNSKKDFNSSSCKNPDRFTPSLITKIVNQISGVSKKFKENSWVFINQSYEKSLQDLPENSFIYADPPYLGRNTDYFSKWTEEDERKLVNLLKSQENPFLLSSWLSSPSRKNENIEIYWKDYKKEIIEHTYFIGPKIENRPRIQEVLISNY